MTRTSAAPVPTTPSAANAAGMPMPRPLGGSTGPVATAVACGLGGWLGGSWMGPAGETGGWIAPPPVGAADRECRCADGVGATCGPVPPDDVGTVLGAGAGVGVFECGRADDGAGAGAAATVIEPCAVLPGADAEPLVAVTAWRPDVVPT